MSDLRPEIAVEHPFHGRGIICSLSPGRVYAVVRYPSGYRRTHHVADLTRVTPLAETDAAS